MIGPSYDRFYNAKDFTAVANTMGDSPANIASVYVQYKIEETEETIEEINEWTSRAGYAINKAKCADYTRRLNDRADKGCIAFRADCRQKLAQCNGEIERVSRSIWDRIQHKKKNGLAMSRFEKQFEKELKSQ